MIFQTALIQSLRNNADRTAIEHGQGRVTYAALLNRANAVTSALLKKGLGKDSLIGIRLNDRVDIIAAMIGVLNARCVFVLLDGTLPAERQQRMVSSLNLQYLIDEQLTDGCEGAIDPVYPTYEEEDSIYIYFTSGSTGTPKGIVGKNSSLLQFLKWEITCFSLTASVRVSQFISPYFDAFLRDVFVPLLTGGTICIPPSEKDFLVPEQISRWIDEHRISLIHCVPGFFRLINHQALTSVNYISLQYVLLSGEKIIPGELRSWYHLFGQRTQLVNLYGPTEATMIRTFYCIRPEDAQLSKMPVGIPIDDTEVVILDKAMKPCAPLVPGDLYIISDYLTKGYWNNPALNEEKFMLLNSSTGNKKPAFKTGDRARILTDGNIDLLGREDRQIKLRGIRIELDEIELVILQSGLVKNAIVVEHTLPQGEMVLNAFVIGGEIDADLSGKVLEYLRRHLPDYMVPAVVHVVADFPLLSNGKINYKELIARSKVRTIVAPLNETEQQLLNIWQNILGNVELSTEDNFHSMGGNSISIMKLIGSIYKVFNVRISLEEIFKRPSIKSQADCIDQLKKDMLLVIGKAAVKPFYNVSAAQSRVYYNYILNTKRTSYNLPMTWELKQPPDKRRLQKAFRLLIQRHESLRTWFSVEAGKVVQHIMETADVFLETYTSTEEALQDKVLEFVRPFDLGKAPLLRAALITTDTGRYMLAVDLHHIICDGMSQKLLQADFNSFYYEQPPEPLPLQYKDYAEWEYQYKQTEDYLLYRQFWLKCFKEKIPELTLPVVNAQHDDLSETGGNSHVEVSKHVLQPVLDYVQQNNLTTSSAFFSIYYLFLSQITGQDDIVIGMAATGRIQQELEQVAGMFVKTLPIRYRLNTALPFSAVLTSLSQFIVEALSNQVYDLEDLVSELKTNRLFNVGFVYLNYNKNAPDETDGDFITCQFDNRGAKNAITLYISEKAERVYIRFEYAHAYFTHADIELLVKIFTTLPDKIAAHLHDPVSHIIGNPVMTAPVTQDDITFSF